MRRSPLVGLAILLPLAALAAERGIPSFPKRTGYEDARTSLLALGWAPTKLSGAAECDADDERCAGRPEMLFCSGTGLARCAFIWKRGDTLIEVETFGEVRPIVDKIRCRAGCG